MFDEFVKQFKRLFSSKCNGGKLVYNLSDKLHYYKQILLAIGIILLLGYSQFRAHFECQGSDRVDSKTLTNFCWINGTTTVNRIAADGTTTRVLAEQNGAGRAKLLPSKASILADNPKIELPTGSSILDQIVPHVGIHFRLNENKYELINHNYMRSLWALLLMMIACSYVASRKWANIFADNTLKALLNLPGNEELPAVKKAQALKPYEELMRVQPQPLTIAIDQRSDLSSDDNNNSNNNNNTNSDSQHQIFPATARAHQQPQQQPLSLKEVFGQNHGLEFVAKMNMLVGDENDYNHALDYYPNQLIYLLMPINSSAYKLTKLRLRRQLLGYSLWSLVLTLMQFLLPLSFIGPKYLWYGWEFACLALTHVREQIEAYPRSTQVNSWDYELTSSIWPISTACEYKHFGLQGMERIIVQCTVPINEICGKLFVVIWWFVAVNIVVELWLFARLLICSVNFAATEWTFGRLFWPRTRSQAKVINQFRYRHADLFASAEAEAAERRLLEQEHQQASSTLEISHHHHHHHQQRPHQTPRKPANDSRRQPHKQVALSPGERKRLEAERGSALPFCRSDSQQSLASSSSSNHRRCRPWWSRDVSLLFSGNGAGNGKGDDTRQEQQFGGAGGKHHSAAIINLPVLGVGRRQKQQHQQPQLERDFLKDKNWFCEQKHDEDLYYLLYLLYLRLDCSRKKVEQVIRMTSEALSRYLDKLDWPPGRLVALAGPLLAAGPTSSSTSTTTTSTTIVPSPIVAAAPAATTAAAPATAAP